MSNDLVWRLLLGIGTVPALSVFYLRRKLKETPRFVLAQKEAASQERAARGAGLLSAYRAVLADGRLRRCLIGASSAWLLFDIAYYGNTIASPTIIKQVAPHASEIGSVAYSLLTFGVFARPGHALAARAAD